jgi:hypothetical protein
LAISRIFPPEKSKFAPAVPARCRLSAEIAERRKSSCLIAPHRRSFVLQ